MSKLYVIISFGQKGGQCLFVMDLSYTKLQQHLRAQVKNKEGFRFCLKVSYFNVVRREVTWYLGLVDGKELNGEHCSAKQKWWMGKKVTVINALQNKNELGRDATVLQFMRSWLAMCMWAKKEPNLTEYQNWRKKSETTCSPTVYRPKVPGARVWQSSQHCSWGRPKERQGTKQRSLLGP